MNRIDYDKIIKDINELIWDVKNNTNIIKNASTVLNVLLLGEYLDKHRSDLNISTEALVLIDFRNRVAHMKPSDKVSIESNLETVLDIIKRIKKAEDLVKGILPEEKKKSKKKSIRNISDAEILREFEVRKLDELSGNMMRITNAPSGSNFNLERNYIILPDSVTDTVTEEELKSIIYDAFGSHAVLRLVKNIKQTTIEKESHGSIAIMADGSVKLAFLVDARTGKQINFKKVKTIKKIQ